MFYYSIGWHLRSTPKKGTLLHVLELQVCYMRKSYRLTTDICISKSDYEIVCSGNNLVDQRYKEIKRRMRDFEIKSTNILDSMNEFDFSIFKQYFHGEIKRPIISQYNNIENGFDLLIMEYQQVGKNTSNYVNAKKSIMKYAKWQDTLLTINSIWLEKYVKKMRDDGRSQATAFLYLRCFKRVYNYLIKNNLIPKSVYPFTTFHMQKARKTKSALLPDEIEIFWNYTTTNALKMEAKRYWFLCYLANGLNPKDLFLLKKKNVKRNIITFMRNKTLRTDSEQIEISIPITSALQELLNSFGYKHLQHDDYLVPILRNIETERLGTEITHAKRRINYQLSLISDELKLEEKPMLKNARHSFATMLLYTGNRELAREMLGHSSQDTTDHYLASLPIDRFIKASEKLLDFGKK